MLNISDRFRKRLSSEIRFCRTKMLKEQDPRMKLYYYSGVYSEITRIMNFEYEPHLQFIHYVLSTSYQAIIIRVNQVLSNQSNVPISPEFFNHLANLLERLENDILANRHSYETLEKISNLAYTTTGNGHFLNQKGIQVFSEE